MRMGMGMDTGMDTGITTATGMVGMVDMDMGSTTSPHNNISRSCRN